MRGIAVVRVDRVSFGDGIHAVAIRGEGALPARQCPLESCPLEDPEPKSAPPAHKHEPVFATPHDTITLYECSCGAAGTLATSALVEGKVRTHAEICAAIEWREPSTGKVS